MHLSKMMTNLLIPCAIFTASIRFPFVGTQNITLQLETESRARISLKGFINVEDSFRYTLHEDGRAHFDLSDKIKTILDKYMCTLSNARLENDDAIVRLRIRPLRYNHDILLKKLHDVSKVHDIPVCQCELV